MPIDHRLPVFQCVELALMVWEVVMRSSRIRLEIASESLDSGPQIEIAVAVWELWPSKDPDPKGPTP